MRTNGAAGTPAEVAAKVPAGTPRVTLTVLPLASTSLMLMPVIAEATSSVTAIEPGTVLTGASLTALTVTLAVAVSVTPPEVSV